MRSRLSNCEHYDPNVSRYEPDPGNVARIVIRSGQPFLKRTTFTSNRQKIRLYANDNFLQASFPFETGLDPFSINRKDEIYFFETVAEMKAGAHHYQIFSRKGGLNENQGAFIHLPAFKHFVASLHLAPSESLHIYRNGLSIYLLRPTTDRGMRILDSAVSFLAEIAPSSVAIDFSVLPPQFWPLISLVERWGMSDDAERDQRRQEISRAALEGLVNEIKPYFSAINSYLDSFGDGPQPDAAVALGMLAEFAAETDLYIKETKNEEQQP